MDYSLVKEFIKNNTSSIVMDVKDNSLEVKKIDEDDLNTMDEAGIEVVSTDLKGIVEIEVKSMEKFEEKYNEWIENEKKINIT
jgi:SpoVK/Ycf46/Vps4 family AAA+-type ATPase